VVVVTNKGAEVRGKEIAGKIGRDSGIEIWFVKDFLSVLKRGAHHGLQGHAKPS
jgi:hypothetical protein